MGWVGSDFILKIKRHWSCDALFTSRVCDIICITHLLNPRVMLTDENGVNQI